MEQKKTILSTVKKRTENTQTEVIVDNKERRYEILKQTIVLRTEAEIKSQIEIAKALYEIKEHQLYLYDNYKNFSSFLKNYNKGRTQAYRYINVISGIEQGILEESDIFNFGFKFAERKLVDNHQNAKNTKSTKTQFLLTFSINQFKDEKKRNWILENKKNIETYILQQINHNFSEFSKKIKKQN